LREGADYSVNCRIARFGLVQRSCKDPKQARDLGRMTCNDHSETANEAPSYRAAWFARQRGADTHEQLVRVPLPTIVEKPCDDSLCGLTRSHLQ
jgi:hypothetical protein